MQNGDYIIDRQLPKIIRTVCASQGISVAMYSDDWVIRLTKGSVTRMVVGYRFDLNTSAASEVAQDKVAASQILEANNVSVVKHVLARSVESQPVNRALIAKEFADKIIVVKPLTGTGGRGIQQFKQVEDAIAYMENSTEPAWTVSEFLTVQSEIRLIMLDGKMLLAYEKNAPVTRHGMPFFNLGVGAVAQNIVPDNIATNLAIKAVYTLGLRLAAVDIVTLSSGEQRILEVNDGLMMENYALQSEDYKNCATEVYHAVIQAMFR